MKNLSDLLPEEQSGGVDKVQHVFKQRLSITLSFHNESVAFLYRIIYHPFNVMPFFPENSLHLEFNKVVINYIHLNFKTGNGTDIAMQFEIQYKTYAKFLCRYLPNFF